MHPFSIDRLADLYIDSVFVFSMGLSATMLLIAAIGLVRFAIKAVRS